MTSRPDILETQLGKGANSLITNFLFKSTDMFSIEVDVLPEE